ncbi:MAG: TusE/DsrC/DsvC family sulfur relay protein [Gammaproteobacteria bacterium]|nr:TusE/DsrC/DsvC family sulfur relay protein [Rhodocyclaceae bacterium]MBU3909748.1 TusE/DsrC/DsvC family sulfur relay protein [Gammaproteobacteria bacterium]MBU3989297.1 TusE/DsrC/DsvC family sulfur relay protein [Gammaproteobacteria bacterium]MBU4005281.1 TusE/DsrC/DsvC family sulfur relay protein [Gammaproteobacteria bacterium]MBU4022459.1 TusE/DsrC/DsvC family sulfur relay protein [Gammaproteobacteria bacterium]
MSYVINGVEKEADDYGYLLEPDYSEEAVQAIAAADNIQLTDDHMKVINFLREKFKEDGHTPNLRNLIKGLQDEGDMPHADSALLFELFPDGGAAKQGCRVAGLPQPKGKGGY